MRRSSIRLQLVAKLINPLGPDPGPEGIASRPDYAVLRALGHEIARVSEELQQIDTGRIHRVAHARRTLVSAANRPADRPALLRVETDTERLTGGRELDRSATSRLNDERACDELVDPSQRSGSTGCRMAGSRRRRWAQSGQRPQWRRHLDSALPCN